MIHFEIFLLQNDEHKKKQINECNRSTDAMAPNHISFSRIVFPSSLHAEAMHLVYKSKRKMTALLCAWQEANYYSETGGTTFHGKKEINYTSNQSFKNAEKIVLTTFSQSGIYTVHAFVQWFIIIACCIICFRDTTKLGAKSSWQIVLKVIISIYLGRCTSNQPCGHLLIKSVLFQPTLIISYK